MIFEKCFFCYLAFVSLILFAGCENDIEGIYVANHNTGYDTLKIYPYNKFVRIYYDPSYKLNSKIYADTGRWNLDNGSIYFRDWLDRFGTQRKEEGKKIIFGADIKKSFFSNETKLIIDYDKNYYYLKQK